VKNQCLEIVINQDPHHSSHNLASLEPNAQELPLLENCTTDPSEIQDQEMSANRGSDMLAKQKHHHRKAFEYISQALRIDEENQGI
jgi:hypothetical protein